jgi:hypothetical protein
MKFALGFLLGAFVLAGLAQVGPPEPPPRRYVPSSGPLYCSFRPPTVSADGSVLDDLDAFEFTVSATAPGTDASIHRVRVADGIPQDPADPTLSLVELTTLLPGLRLGESYFLFARAVDTSGNASTWAQSMTDFVYSEPPDRTPPAAPTDVDASGGTVVMTLHNGPYIVTTETKVRRVQ